MRPRSTLPTALLGLLLAGAGAGQEPDPQPEGPRMPLPGAEEIAALPPDGGPEFNRLVFEQSPYLLQHARNPVDWYPWGEAAFEKARAEDKPVFLSIGYSTCHWCHVMEHESFEDAEVAALLNAHFVPVKVDREERPDIDQLYMTYTQLVTGSGGWPMTVLLTPDKKPFYAGTYFPKRGRFGRPGMMDLVPSLSRAWHENRQALLAGADQAVERLGRLSAGSPGPALDAATIAIAAQQLSSRFDDAHGGFGERPKFPVPHNLRLLLRQARRSGEERPIQMVAKTLTEMRRGGIWDQVGFGFHRYSTDPEWLVPHFEKMLYDQALLAMACVEAWQVTGDELHRETAEQIVEYVLRDMTDPAGGFYSAEDADSEGEEGLFYLWTPAQLAEVLGQEDAKLAAGVWNVVEGGNFRDESSGERPGGSILHLEASLAELARQRGLEPAALEARLDAIRAKLFEAREARVHPLKDDKVLTDWNGLMIAALSLAARAFDEPRYEAAARKAADFALAHLRDDTGRLFKRWRQGQAALPGVLDDYAFLAWGLLELYESSFDLRYLEAAIALTDQALAHFQDPERGGFYLAPDDGEDLIVRTRETYDGALPSGNSVMFANLVRLGRLTGEERYEELAERTMLACSGDVGASPGNFTQFLLGLDLAVGPSHEVVVVGEPGAEDTRAMLRALQRPFLPNKVVLLRPVGEPGELCELAEYTRPLRALDGRATAYVCQGFACLQPTTDVAAMLESLGVE